MTQPFSFATTPQLHFGRGKHSVLPSAIKTFGKRALLVTEASSFISVTHGQTLLETLKGHSIDYDHYVIRKEPAPVEVDRAVLQFSSSMPDCVVAIGGGSALDAGKAISAMLRLQEPVTVYLEGVGSKSHPGTKIPFIAMPTISPASPHPESRKNTSTRSSQLPKTRTIQ